MLLSILIIITPNSLSDNLLASILTSSSSGEFSCSFHFGSISLSSHFSSFFVFSFLVVKLISDMSSSCNQQPDSGPAGCGRVIPMGGAIASPQADATWRRVSA